MTNNEKEKSFLSKEISTENIISLLLYSVILIMPFVVVNVSNPRYVVGKLVFLYIVGIILFYLSIKVRFKNFNIYHKISFIFLLTAFIPSILSPQKYVAFMGSFDRGEGFFIYCIYILLFVLSSRYLIVNSKTIKITFLVVSIMAIYGVFQFYGFDPIQGWMFGEIIAKESIGFIGHRNFFSTYLCIFLFLSTAIYIFKGNKIYLMFSSIFFAALLCSLTRGGWLAFLIYSFVGGILILKRKECLKRALLIFISFTLVFIALNITTDNKVIGRADKELIISEEGEFRNSAGARVDILRMSFRAFLDKPFLGEGPDSLKMRLLKDYPEESLAHTTKYNEIIDKSHNEFLELAVSNGIFNLISYLALIGLILYNLIKKSKNDSYKILALTLFGYLVQSFLNISVIMVAPIYWIFLGYCVKSLNKEMF